MNSAYIVDNGFVYEIPQDSNEYDSLQDFIFDKVDYNYTYGTTQECLGKICEYAVKNEIENKYKEEIDSLNGKLAHLEQLEKSEQNFYEKQRELEKEYQRKLTQIREELLVDAIGKIRIPLYYIKHTFTQPSKCNVCDDNRKVHFKSPYSGADIVEDCPYCGKSLLSCEVAKTDIVAFDISSVKKICDAGEPNVVRFRVGNNEYYKINYNNIITKEPADWSPFDDIDTYFEDESLAQKYCEWLRSNAKEKTNE